MHVPAHKNSVTATEKNGKSITVSGGNKYTFKMPSSKITVTPIVQLIFLHRLKRKDCCQPLTFSH